MPRRQPRSTVKYRTDKGATVTAQGAADAVVQAAADGAPLYSEAERRKNARRRGRR